MDVAASESTYLLFARGHYSISATYLPTSFEYPSCPMVPTLAMKRGPGVVLVSIWWTVDGSSGS